MALADKILAYLKKIAPDAHCDMCIGTALGSTRSTAVGPSLYAFGLTRDFKRVVGECAKCGRLKSVTQYLLL